MTNTEIPAPDLLGPLRDWALRRERLPQERADRIVTAWKRGARNINQLAEATGVHRNTIYDDLRDRGIDYTDRDAPVDPDVGTTDAYAHLVGRRVTAHTTATASVTGTLMGPDPCCGLHPIEVGGGVEVLLRPAHVADIAEYAPGPTSTDGKGHFLADYQDQITDADWVDARAVHEATHAVVGMIVGMDLEVAWVATDRNAHVGGMVSFAPFDAQLATVHMLAGPMAHARRVGELGYDHLTQAAVELLGGQGDHGRVAGWEGQGLVVWRSQAQRDATALLDTPTVWEAIHTVATALIERDRLDAADIGALIGDPVDLTSHQVWRPNV